jgi:hypothetical protein
VRSSSCMHSIKRSRKVAEQAANRPAHIQQRDRGRHILNNKIRKGGGAIRQAGRQAGRQEGGCDRERERKGTVQSNDCPHCRFEVRHNTVQLLQLLSVAAARSTRGKRGRFGGLQAVHMHMHMHMRTRTCGLKRTCRASLGFQRVMHAHRAVHGDQDRRKQVRHLLNLE